MDKQTRGQGRGRQTLLSTHLTLSCHCPISLPSLPSGSKEGLISTMLRGSVGYALLVPGLSFPRCTMKVLDPEVSKPWTLINSFP